MKYKELHSVTYDFPEWEKVTAAFVAKWNKKLKTESLCYMDDNTENTLFRVKTLNTPEEKFNFLINYEECGGSPLNNFRYEKYRGLLSENNMMHLDEKMWEDYLDMCRTSFIMINTPVLFGVDYEEDPRNEYANHQTKIRSVFDRNSEIQEDVEKRFDEILNNHFLFKDLCLLFRYKLPNNSDLKESVKSKLDKLILGCKWKVVGEDNKLKKPDNPLEFINNYDDDDDDYSILSNIYVTSKRTLLEEIQIEAKKKYYSAFVLINVDDGVKETLLADSVMAKLGKFFEKHYTYLAEQFSDEILNMYDKSAILELFEKTEAGKQG